MMSLLSSRHIVLLSVFQFLYRRHLIILQHRHDSYQKETQWLALMETHSDVTKACSLMVVKTSQNLIFVVRVCPW